MEYIPYVYLIKNKTTGLKYLGVRYAKGCNPKDFWIDYFTSSGLVKSLIKQFGVDDFVFKIIHTYPENPKEAILKEAHYFKFIKKRKDYLNITYSSGLQDLRVSSKGGKVGGAIVKSRKIGIFRDYEERKKWASMGGKIGGKKQADLGLGFHVYKTDPERHRQWASKGGLKGCEKNGWRDPEIQSKNGKKGGPKNKGFVWVNDGVKSFKYSPKKQKEKTISDFLLENPNFKIGRLNTYTKGKIWVNDGERSYMIEEKIFDEKKLKRGKLNANKINKKIGS